LKIQEGDKIKQMTIISGKGGTGKTSIAAAFANLAKNAVFADCDVDAADLHLILKPDIKETIEFSGLKVACKDPEKCVDCGECREACRFDAIDENFEVRVIDCEGCGVCVHLRNQVWAHGACQVERG
jgi:MinD superfamily P-loop ATPase